MTKEVWCCHQKCLVGIRTFSSLESETDDSSDRLDDDHNLIWSIDLCCKELYWQGSHPIISSMCLHTGYTTLTLINIDNVKQIHFYFSWIFKLKTYPASSQVMSLKCQSWVSNHLFSWDIITKKISPLFLCIVKCQKPKNFISYFTLRNDNCLLSLFIMIYCAVGPITLSRNYVSRW